MNKLRKFTLEDLKALKPCVEALDWIDEQPDKTPSVLWDACPRSDWLFWILRHVRPLNKKESVKMAVLFAEGCLDKFENCFPDDKRPRQAIEAAKRYLKNPNEKNALAAAESAESARLAVRSAAESADLAESAAWAAWWAARSAAWWAAESAAWTARSAAWTARSAVKRNADIIRSVIENPFIV